MKKSRLVGVIFFLLLTSYLAANDDYTLEELDSFLKDGMITEEEYLILKNEISGFTLMDENFLYEILINNSIRNRGFKLDRKEGILFYPLIDFLYIVGAENYEINEEGVTLLLGEELIEARINYSTKTYEVAENKYGYKEGEVYKDKGEIYITEEIFKNLFTKTLEKDDKEFTIKTNLKFKTRYEIDLQLKNRELRFEEENGKDILFFTNKSSLFDLGYLNFDLSLNYNSEQEDRLTRTGSLEYQGGFLFGEVTTSYDLNSGKIGDFSIYYPNYIKGHSMEVGSYGSGSKNRELGFSLKKEKGYYDVEGEIIIREKVPTGSRVELLYLGFPIDLKEAENGEVEFKNSELRSDRNYELKVYSPDGKIEIIEINTDINHNQQKKGSFEYEIEGRESKARNEILGSAKVYYGYSNYLTLGLGYEKEVLDTEVIDYMNTEVILGSTYKDIDYTFVLEKDFAEKGWEATKLEGDISYKDFNFVGNIDFYGKSHENKRDEVYSLEYTGFDYINLQYNYYVETKNNEERNHDYDIGFNIDYTYEDILVTADFNLDRDRDQDYDLNFYYKGHYKYDVRFNNSWSTEDDTYEGKLSIGKKQNIEGLDYSFDMMYSNKEESRFGFSFSLELDDWLSFDMGKRGKTKGGSLNIERVVDLRNFTKTSDTMDVSRVKAITFLDENNNNLYDKAEKKLPYSKVIIGDKEGTTNEKGVAWIYGVENDIVYDVETIIKRPSYSMGENKLKLQGKRSGSIEAYLPVKAKVNFRGEVNLNLNLDEESKKNIYEKMAVRIKNSEGEFIETLFIEEDGSFILSDIYPDTYIAEFTYWGEEYTIDNKVYKAKVKYLEGEDEIFKINIEAKKNIEI